MARARNIKPSFFRNEQLVELPFEDRLLFAGLWTLADKEGRLENRPKKIKMEIFPGDDVDIAQGLSRLSEAGLVHLYQARNTHCIQVINFKKHQNPHHREPDSELPDPSKEEPQDAENKEASESPGQARGEPEDSRADSGSRIPDSGEKNNAQDASGDASSPNPVEPDSETSHPKHLTEAEFDEFWSECRTQWFGEPGKRNQAKPYFLKIKRDDIDPKSLIEAVRADARDHFRRHRAGEFAPPMKHVCRWLRYRCWEDVTDQAEAQTRNPNALPGDDEGGYGRYRDELKSAFAEAV